MMERLGGEYSEWKNTLAPDINLSEMHEQRRKGEEKEVKIGSNFIFVVPLRSNLRLVRLRIRGLLTNVTTRATSA